jgi:regulator of PEP synthase PpsR (kinase-PPPase family)
MSNTYQIYLISDSTGETLDRIFLALKAQLPTLNIMFILILSLEQKIKF